MASAWRFRHASSDVRRILQTMFNDDLDKIARDIGAGVEIDLGTLEHDAPVIVDSYTSDRHVATVTIASAAGLPIEAKHGVLTRVAAEHGFTVK